MTHPPPHPYVAITPVGHGLDRVFFANNNDVVIESILLEHKKAQHLASCGFSPAHTLLFYGPGSGKRVVAQAMAFEMGWAFGEVRTALLRAEPLEKQNAVLHALWALATQHPMVLFFEAFDAWFPQGPSRQWFLEGLSDAASPHGLVVATSHQDTLDPEVRAYFDEALFFSRSLTFSQRSAFWVFRLEGVRHTLDADVLCHWSAKTEGMTYGEIARLIQRALKIRSLQGEDVLHPSHVLTAWVRERG
jgi:AAA+ superfamily predicted ATPase